MSTPVSRIHYSARNDDRGCVVNGLNVLIVMMVPLVAACDSEQQAGCTQIQVAACAARAHCGGIDEAVCEGQRAGLTSSFCSVSVDEATICVTAVNKILATTCTTIPTLPCPDVAGQVGDACRVEAECASGLTCDGGACADPGGAGPGPGTTTPPSAPYLVCSTDGDCGSGLTCRHASSGSLCTKPCHSSIECPGDTGTSNPDLQQPDCQVIEAADNTGFCLARCRSVADCDVGLVCNEAGDCAP